MKVNSNKDSVELSHLARTKKGEKAASARAKENAEATGGAIGAGATANVEISGEAKALAAANQIAKSEDVNQAKVDRVKALIAQGNYKPDYSQVADKVVNETLLSELS